MSEELLIVGVVLLVVGFAIVPAIVDEIVPPVVERVLRSVERVAMAFVNRIRPADALPAERIKRLEAELVALNASVQQLAAEQKGLLGQIARESSEDSSPSRTDASPKSSSRGKA